jgi:putative ABC transport system permease protein
MSLAVSTPTPTVAEPAIARSTRGRRTWVAWKNLVHDKRRLALALAGVGFAVLLMFMQFGFRTALLESTVALPKRLHADLILVHKGRIALLIPERFARSVLYQAQGFDGVAHVEPLYIDTQRSSWRPAGPNTHGLPIRTVAFNPLAKVFADPVIESLASKLTDTRQVLFDVMSKSDYGKPQPGDPAFHTGHEVRVAGLFRMGTDFGTDATVMISDRTFAQWFAVPGSSADPLERIDLGLVTLVAGADPRTVQRQLQAKLPEQIVVKTKSQYIADERGFWQDSTPVGYVFGFGTALGFVVGMIICYQVLYADVTDHLSEYATLMAIGYAPRYFVMVVMQQALLLSVLAFLPASVLAWLLYGVLAFFTGLPLTMDLQSAALVLGLTAIMCCCSGLFALRRLLQADPAELFR